MIPQKKRMIGYFFHRYDLVNTDVRLQKAYSDLELIFFQALKMSDEHPLSRPMLPLATTPEV